jgi:hypothetical protein
MWARPGFVEGQTLRIARATTGRWGGSAGTTRGEKGVGPEDATVSGMDVIGAGAGPWETAASAREA